MATQLGDFLRARRGELHPSGEAPARRRVPGLRREEVAADAGISVDYYVRLEQGREGHPSDAVLAALTRALRLQPDAAEHLRVLRDGPVTGGVVLDEAAVTQRMEALTDAVRSAPAYVMDRLSTMVAANAEGLSLFAGFADLPPHERNTCRYLLTDPQARETFVEWEDLARGAVAHLRAANADRLDDPGLVDFVGELTAESAEFGPWWASRSVARRRASTVHIRTDGGVVARRFEVLHLPDESLRMTLWLPERGEQNPPSRPRRRRSTFRDER